MVVDGEKKRRGSYENKISLSFMEIKKQKEKEKEEMINYQFIVLLINFILRIER